MVYKSCTHTVCSHCPASPGFYLPICAWQEQVCSRQHPRSIWLAVPRCLSQRLRLTARPPPSSLPEATSRASSAVVVEELVTGALSDLCSLNCITFYLLPKTNFNGAFLDQFIFSKNIQTFFYGH